MSLIHIKHLQQGLVHSKHSLLAVIITKSEFKFKALFKYKLWYKKVSLKIWKVSWIFKDSSITSCSLL